MSQNELASIYLAYNTLTEDKRPKESQVTRGYIEDKDKVVFPIFPVAKIANGRKWTIDGGSTNHAKTTVTYYSLPHNVGQHTYMVLKLIEYESLIFELGWDDHEKKLMTQLISHQQKASELEADIANKFNGISGDPLAKKDIDELKKTLSQHKKQISHHVNALNDNAERAGGMLGKLMGHFDKKFAVIIDNYFNQGEPHQVTKWRAVNHAFCKDAMDSSKIMIPLMSYTGTVKKGSGSGGAISDRPLKEFKFRAGIADHDLERKTNNMLKYLGKGHAIRVTLTARQRSLNEDAQAISTTLDRVKELIGDRAVEVRGMKANDRLSYGNLLFHPSNK